MPRLLFEKTGSAVWISHLDLMRLFQRAFKRAGLPLTHTQGFNPRPSVSIAMPMSVGVESCCELLDFDLYGEPIPHAQILTRLNDALVAGVRVLQVYDEGKKIKHLAYLSCAVTMEYDRTLPDTAADSIRNLFAQPEVLVEKKSKNGVTQQNIIPMIQSLQVIPGEGEIRLEALVCCQNPSLNPMQLSTAVTQYLPELAPDHVLCARLEIYDTENKVFR